MNQLYALPRPRSRKPHPVRVVCWLLGLLAGDHSVAQTPAFPFPQTVVYTNGATPGTVSSADARTAYQSWKTNYLETCPNGNVWVRFDNPANLTIGLVSDWQRADNGTPGDAGCGANFVFQGKRYFYDAARTPWRIGIDYLRGHTDAKPWLDKQTTFVQGSSVGGIANVKDGYEQNGTVTGQYHTVPFLGGFVVAVMASSQTTANTFANRCFTHHELITDTNQ